MRLINFLQILGLSKMAGYSDAGKEPDYHHHDTTDGSELLDETTHMHEQPFNESDEEDSASIF